jgi:hypothetical protein
MTTETGEEFLVSQTILQTEGVAFFRGTHGVVSVDVTDKVEGNKEGREVRRVSQRQVAFWKQ